jgi:hypothetical protein
VVSHHKSGKKHLEEKKMNRNTDNFQKIPVKKKPKVGHRDGWKLVRKLQRRGKLILQEKVHA